MKEGVNPIIPSYAIACVDKYSPGPPGGCCPLSPAKSFAGWRQVIQMKGTVYTFFGYVTNIYWNVCWYDYSHWNLLVFESLKLKKFVTSAIVPL